MVRRLARRSFLAHSATVATTLSLPWASRAPVRRRDHRDLARRLRDAPRGGVFTVAIDAARHGARPVDLLGAAGLAGAQTIPPRPVGNHLHALLLVDAARRLGAESDDLTAWHLTFWTLDALERARSAHEGWQPSTPPPRPPWDRETACNELKRGLTAWDDERCDRATIALVDHVEAWFDTLRPFVARSAVDLGHKAVFAAHAERLIATLGSASPLALMRSLIRALLHTRHGARFDEAFIAANDLASKPGAISGNGPAAPEQSLAVLRAIRGASRAEAQQAVIDAQLDGLSAETLWDAVHLMAHDVLARRAPGTPESFAALGPVHAVTASSALAMQRTRLGAHDQTVTLLSAVGWVCDLRDDLARRVDLRTDGPGLQAAWESDAKAVTVKQLWHLDRPTSQQAFACLNADPGRAREFGQRLREQLAPKAVEVHQLKYAAALCDDVSRVHPRWRPALWSLALPYVPHDVTPATELHARIERALTSAGLH